jgi:hypothetical protein
MAWSTRTWLNGETVTDTLLNTHLKDNLDYLKGKAGQVDLESTVSFIDTNHYIGVAGASTNLPSHIFATNDRIEYDRSSDAFRVIINSTTWLDVSSLTGVRIGDGVGLMSAERHVSTGIRHMEGSTAATAASTVGVAITFSNAYGTVPMMSGAAVFSSNLGAAVVHDIHFHLLAVSGVSLVAVNGTPAYVTSTVHWLAEGRD